jgi:hypothetical protein
MLRVADNLIVNKDLRTYYGVGSPSPMPFENAIEKKNLVDGNILKAYALLGMDNAEAAVDRPGQFADVRSRGFHCPKLHFSPSDIVRTGQAQRFGNDPCGGIIIFYGCKAGKLGKAIRLVIIHLLFRLLLVVCRQPYTTPFY